MEIFKIKKTQQLALMISRSRDTYIIVNSNIIPCRTINVLRREDGSIIAAGDEDIEFVREEMDE